MAASNRHVMWHGMFLFLLGMLTAFVEPMSRPMCAWGLPRALGGLDERGIFLIALGAI